MTLNRRHFLLWLGTTVGAVACGGFPQSRQPPAGDRTLQLAFQPIKSPIPLPTSGVAVTQQMADFSTYEVLDDLVLPEGYTYSVIASWGDRVGTSRIGYNNDYLSFIETGKGKGLLAINFEYISAIPWLQTYSQVIGKSLPFEDVQKAVEAATKTARGEQPPGLNAYELDDRDPLKAKVEMICREALIDQGVGVISIQQASNGAWKRTYSPQDRRITGISGLTDGRYLKSTGPAVAVFRKTSGKGYMDKLGDKIIGTFQNCAGGTTPWGTVLSAEENFQGQVPELVYPDGTSFHPKERPFTITTEELGGLGNVFGLAGNKYGWIVEFDPADPQDNGTKHTWLGRYRHEAVGIRVVEGKPLAFYSGCDRQGGHLYKFVSRNTVTDARAKTNSKLLAEGMLYAAQFNPDGTGSWIPLAPGTPVNPTPPTFLSGVMLPLPKRPEGGIFRAEGDEQIRAFKQQFKTLGELYTGSAQEKQGAILIDAHYAANAAGATCTARPEDTVIAPDGSLLIAFTSGSVGKETGSPDLRIFKGPDGSSAYEFGWIMRLLEEDNEPAARSFRWEMIATGGEPASGGAGFANPDNLALDPKGNLWMVTDMSSSKMNQEVPQKRVEPNGKTVSQSSLRGIFGNNSIWYMPLSGETAGHPFLFGMGPMDCETTGPCFTSDAKTLFLSVQHPGEVNGVRKDMAVETRQFSIRTTDGQEFIQTRHVPIGSNWPTKQPNDPPRPSVVAVYRQDRQAIA
ncbi:DUF839 domain-containing protein [Leptothermofonsia sichuanensis E412]|uniref:PhoX family protein n=1 Tax=Leptothermofonsia sichuanensis TaxID=2917832 RepID=UPI001CA67E8E|nr:alkaline phosphatase PhoX [Leptothermofonsia sichuanensis]QZZ18766.1 DUF839 domain-containing protein [Leptothermofonsia sichuanensis E412]